jgi:hypothetical protein
VPCANASDGRVPATAERGLRIVYLLWTRRGPRAYLPCTSRTGPALSAPLLRPFRRRRLGAPPAPGPDCKAPSAQRARSSRAARHAGYAGCLQPRATCQDVRHAGNRGPPRRARWDARGPRDANTRSGCQFASPRASRCAFLLRLVSLAPLFTLADACLTLPMGSQTDTSGRVSDDCRARRADGVRRRARKAETT